MSEFSVDGGGDGDGEPTATAATSAWELLHQTVAIHIDVQQQALRGHTELRLRIPSSPAIPEIRLNCASQIKIDSCFRRRIERRQRRSG